MIIRKGLLVSIGNENYSAMFKILLLKTDSSYMKLIFLDSYSERENKKIWLLSSVFSFIQDIQEQ